MLDDRDTPFRGRQAAPPTMNVLRRFTKLGGHVVEIRERRVAQFRSFDLFVFIDGEMTESQMFSEDRRHEYAAALDGRAKQFEDGGWSQNAAAG